jgi:hypothetical protein
LDAAATVGLGVGVGVGGGVGVGVGATVGVGVAGEGVAVTFDESTTGVEFCGGVGAEKALPITPRPIKPPNPISSLRPIVISVTPVLGFMMRRKRKLVHQNKN